MFAREIYFSEPNFSEFDGVRKIRCPFGAADFLFYCSFPRMMLMIFVTSDMFT